jgi:hypothetical protein
MVNSANFVVGLCQVLLLACPAIAANDASDALVLEAYQERETYCEKLSARVYPRGEWAKEYKLKLGLTLIVVANKYLDCKNGNPEFDSIPIDVNSYVIILEHGEKAQAIVRGGMAGYKVEDGPRPKLIMIEFDGTESSMDLSDVF